MGVMRQALVNTQLSKPELTHTHPGVEYLRSKTYFKDIMGPLSYAAVFEPITHTFAWQAILQEALTIGRRSL